MSKTRAASVVLAALVLAGAATAQTIVVSPSAAQRCLTRGELTLGAPAYPQESFERRDGGRVLVELQFSRPDAPPSVKIIDDEGGRPFTDSVRTFVEAYRVPCLETGQSATLRQDFVFKPTDGRRAYFSAPIDADAQRQERLQACIAHRNPKERISYPNDAAKRGEHGTVILKLTFSDATSPPAIAVLDGVNSAALRRATVEHAEGYRMPCQTGAAVEFVQFYTYRFEGDAKVLLNDMPLTGFLRHVKGIERANVYFDFNTMGCPFDVRLTLRQPFTANAVGELGTPNPERRFFLDWLRRRELNVDANTLKTLVAQETTISVPCAILSLGNQSGGGGGSK
jgi:Gram-negative bacterial TonB protein C-terminal